MSFVKQPPPPPPPPPRKKMLYKSYYFRGELLKHFMVYIFAIYNCWALSGKINMKNKILHCKTICELGIKFEDLKNKFHHIAVSYFFLYPTYYEIETFLFYFPWIDFNTHLIKNSETLTGDFLRESYNTNES